MTDKDDIFYGLNKAEREALPAMPSFKNKSGAEIIANMPDRFRALMKVASGSVFKRAYFAVSDSYLKKKHEQTNSRYAAELQATDALAGRPQVYTLNESYDFFCTSASRIVDGKPVLLSTLDWGKMPEICHALFHAECEGDHGPYDMYNVTGYSGVFRGGAEGRFAVALNRAPVPTLFNLPAIQKTEREHRLQDKARSHKLGFVFNLAAAVIAFARGETIAKFVSTAKSYTSREKTIPFVLREAFETAADFTQALDMAARTKLSGSGLMVMTGVDETENCAIYRTRNNCVIETTAAGFEKLSAQFADAANVTVLQADKICIANHWPDHIAKILGNGYDRIDFPRARCDAMKAQLDNDHVDLTQGVEVDSTVLYSEYTVADGSSRALAIDNRVPIAYHAK